MNEVDVIVYVDAGSIGLTLFEVRDMAITIANAYPKPGRYVASFGFLNYTLIRTKESCKVEVTEGGGFHNAFGEPVIHYC